MDKNYAKYLISKTKEDYNNIAEEFLKKHKYLPNDIKILADYAVSGERILDLGCGTGYLQEAFGDKNIEYFGADISEKQIAVSKQKYQKANFSVIDFYPLGDRLPYENNYFDKVYCLSVFHHIPSFDFRLQFLKEIKRVLKPNGILILTVWNFWQKLRILKILKYAFLKIIGRFKGDFGDVFLPYKDQYGKVLAERYYHCFTKRELKKIIKEAGFQIKESGILKRGQYENIYIISCKKQQCCLQFG